MIRLSRQQLHRQSLPCIIAAGQRHLQQVPQMEIAMQASLVQLVTSRRAMRDLSVHLQST